MQSALIQSVEAAKFENSTACLAGMRVLILTTGHHVGDPRVYARHARGLHKLGADVALAGQVLKTVPEDVRVLAVTRPRNRLDRFLLQPFRTLWRARKERCDVVHFHDAEMLFVLPIAKLMWPRASFIYDVHEDFANLMLIRNWLPNWLKPAVKVAVTVLEKTLARLADAVVAVTPPLMDKFANRDKETALNYPTRDFYQSCRKVSRPVNAREFDVVHLGTLNLKRASFLCDVLREVCTARPNARTLIIGARPEIAALLEGGLPENCTILEHTGYDDVPVLLGNSRVGLDVHPWAEPHLKVAVPVKVCEYMAAGCAVVCSSMPVLNSILVRSGAVSNLALLEGGTPAEYAQAILKTLSAIDSGANPGAKLRDVAYEHMSWEGESQKIASLYLDLQRRKRAQP